MKAKTKKFTVRELLSRMKGVSSIGIYDKNKQCIEAHPSAGDLMLYIDEPVEEFNVFVYNEPRQTIQGDEYVAVLIRACIYLARYIDSYKEKEALEEFQKNL